MVELIKKQLNKKGKHFIIEIEEHEAEKAGLKEGDIVQIEKCIVTPITKVEPGDLGTYNS
jgi:predicted molibdopterin-dependent oxidoreductase YjgC